MENFDKFDPDIHIGQDEAAALAAIMAHPGFKVVQKICRACVDQFIVGWINQVEDADVLRAHRHAKVAAQLYTMQLRMMKNVVDDYIHSQPTDKPIDSAEALDIGEFSHPEDMDATEEALFE